MKKKVVYISGRISGLSEEEYISKFKRAEKFLYSVGYMVYNPVEANVIQQIYKEYGYKACLAKCVAMLRFCDCIYMLKDWEDSPGAKAEKAFAEACGIEVLYEK